MDVARPRSTPAARRARQVTLRVGAAVLVACSLPASGVGAQPPEPAESEPGAAVARLSAVVSEEGLGFLSGLTAEDFELRDDGTPQTIDGVQSHTTGVRIVGLLLDEFHVAPGSSERVRQLLQQLVDDELRATDRVLVVKPLDRLDAIQPVDGRLDLHDRIATFEGRRGDYTPRSSFEATYLSRAPAAADVQRIQVSVSALRALVLRLGELGPGRKTLVVVSDGLDGGGPPADGRRRSGRRAVPPMGRTRVAGVANIARAALASGVAVVVVAPNGTASADAEDVADDTPESQDGRGGRAQQADDQTEEESRDPIRSLAAQTGGRYLAASSMADGLAGAIREQDQYYDIVYTPDHAWDGRQHRLEVTERRHPEARVLAPKSHWAERPPAEIPDGAGSIIDRILTTRPQRSSRLITSWFGTARGQDGHMRLTFTWEPTGRTGTRRASASALTLKAATPDGTVLFDGRVDPVHVASRRARSRMQASFEVPPGIVQLDMTIEGIQGQTIDTEVRDLDIPDLPPGTLSLSTPELFRARTAREFRDLSSDLAAPPVVARAFHRTERILIRVRAYEADMVTARLVGTTNQPLRTLPTVPVPATDEPGNSPRRDSPGERLVQFDLPLSSLARGQYGIEITARDETPSVVALGSPRPPTRRDQADAPTAREVVRFRVD